MDHAFCGRFMIGPLHGWERPFGRKLFADRHPFQPGTLHRAAMRDANSGPLPRQRCFVSRMSIPSPCAALFRSLPNRTISSKGFKLITEAQQNVLSHPRNLGRLQPKALFLTADNRVRFIACVCCQVREAVSERRRVRHDQWTSSCNRLIGRTHKAILVLGKSDYSRRPR